MVTVETSLDIKLFFFGRTEGYISKPSTKIHSVLKFGSVPGGYFNLTLITIF